MKLYASAPLRRGRQATGDLLVVGWVVLWLWLSRVVHDATSLSGASGGRGTPAPAARRRATGGPDLGA